jgi:hypothetical protein
MTLPASGALSMSAINTEFGRGNNLNAYRGTTWYTDAGASGTFSSGAISFSDFYSKRATSPMFSFTISANQVNANLRTLAVNAGWNQSSALTATIASGVYIYSTSTGTPALTINGSFPGGVTLVNNGTIQGMGGAGGVGGYRPSGSVPATAGAGGGLALSVSVGVSINNANRIAGGGGGGGGAGYITRYYGKMQATDLSGSSGGGGLGGGAGGASVGYLYGFTPNAGQAGTLTSAGAGGAAKIDTVNSGAYNLAGAAGGSYGAAGGTGPSGGNAGGGGGAAGAAVAGNANITWIAVGTRNGGIS